MERRKQRRAHPRFKCTIPVVISKERPRVLSSALMLNYSEGGVYFEISDPLCPGSYIMIKTDDNSAIDPVGSGTWQHRRAEIRWCQEMAPGDSTRFGCGALFVEEE